VNVVNSDVNLMAEKRLYFLLPHITDVLKKLPRRYGVAVAYKPEVLGNDKII
jgi:hypothetical protein